MYSQEEAKTEQREKIGKELDRLNDFLPTVKELDQKKQSLNKLETTVKEKQETAKQLDQYLENKKQEKKGLQEKITPLEKQVKSLPEKTEKIAVMRERAKVLGDYLTLYKLVYETKQELTKQEADFKQVEAEFNQIEQKWIEGQASILANHLHDGKPCPVCGGVSTQIKRY